VKVAAVQHDIKWLDREANFVRLDARIGEAAKAGARLVVLSEMFSTGFAVGETWDASVPELRGGASSQFILDAARKHDVWVAGSCPETTRAGDHPANTLVLGGPGGEVHRYEKIHPFTYGGEHEYFRAGSNTVTVDVEGVSVSLFVCYDLRFADRFWDLAEQTDLYIVPANWPASRATHWSTLLEARAIENQAYVVGVNRVGTGGGLVYAGGSRIIGPFGEDIARAENGETIIYGEVTAQHVREIRARYPFLRDR
jgi:predicted amidohydrolase